jgi:hypothetical protein
MTTKHKDDCKRVWKRYDTTCPRCAELASGAPAIQWRPSRQQQEAKNCAEIRAHFQSHKHLTGGCGPVCTFGEW